MNHQRVEENIRVDERVHIAEVDCSIRQSLFRFHIFREQLNLREETKRFNFLSRPLKLRGVSGYPHKSRLLFPAPGRQDFSLCSCCRLTYR